MKNIKIVCISAVVLLALLGIFQIKFVSASSEVEITVTVPKTEFRLGEIIPVDIGVKNTTNVPLQASVNPCIKVTSKKDNAYKSYASPRNSFTIDGYDAPLILRPQEQKWMRESVFWNDKPQVSHLNKDAAKPEIENRILSDYVFTEAGVYLIKGCTALLINGKWKVVDSSPIEITITDPAADDLEVWNLLKRNGNIGYFLQVGDVPRTFQYKTEERESLLKEIDSILKEYPNNFYSTSLRQSLEKFRASEAKRQEFMQKMQKEKPQ
jgi:hypothetical protein